MPKGIFNSTHSIAVELVGNWPLDFGSGGDGPVKRRIRVLYVEIYIYRRAAQALRTARIHLRKFIGEHDQGIADLDLRVANPAVGMRCTHSFDGGKSLLVKFNRLCGALDAKMRRHRMIALWNCLDCHCPNLPSRRY